MAGFFVGFRAAGFNVLVLKFSVYGLDHFKAETKLTMSLAWQKVLMEPGDKRYNELQRTHTGKVAENRLLQQSVPELSANCGWLRQEMCRRETESTIEHGALRTENSCLLDQSVTFRGRSIALEEWVDEIL